MSSNLWFNINLASLLLGVALVCLALLGHALYRFALPFPDLPRSVQPRSSEASPAWPRNIILAQAWMPRTSEAKLGGYPRLRGTLGDRPKGLWVSSKTLRDPNRPKGIPAIVFQGFPKGAWDPGEKKNIDFR